MTPRELKAGTPIDPVSLGPITLDMLKLYADASGDYNPIHTDEAAAKGAGLPGIIAHGMLSAGFLAQKAVDFMEPWASQWRLVQFKSRFRAMVFLGETITISGTIKSVTAESVTFELKAANSKSELATQATVLFKRKGPPDLLV
jgi:acyl dehydratase